MKRQRRNTPTSEAEIRRLRQLEGLPPGGPSEDMHRMWCEVERGSSVDDSDSDSGDNNK